MKRGWFVVAVVGWLVWGPDVCVGAPPGELKGHGLAPRAAPARRAGGESFPPLPLPATPLRRTELKREPSPPGLVAKAAYGAVRWSVRDGQRVGEREWLNVTEDARNLLRWTGGQLGVSYRAVETELERFSYDPAEIPVLYVTGHESLPELSEELRERMGRFVYDGGTIIANACCGSGEFAESFRREMGRVFPQRRLGRLAADHPVFSSFYRLGEVIYRNGSGEEERGGCWLEGLNIGCRTAVFFAPVDLANGWYGQEPPQNYPEGRWVVGEDARRVGANMIAYVLACYGYGRARAVQEELYEQQEATGGELVIGQIVHDGDWDPTPGGLAGLLRAVRENSTLQVRFKRAEVRLGEREVFAHPVLYMTGLGAFRFAEAEVGRLRTYLQSGGVLVAESACGMGEFDGAFRRELKRVWPEGELKMLEEGHPIYRAAFELGKVSYTPLVERERGRLDAAVLEGVEIDGAVRVVYSRFGLSSGWERMGYPYNRGYRDEDSLRVGVNVLVYAMTQ